MLRLVRAGAIPLESLREVGEIVDGTIVDAPGTVADSAGPDAGATLDADPAPGGGRATGPSGEVGSDA